MVTMMEIDLHQNEFALMIYLIDVNTSVRAKALRRQERWPPLCSSNRTSKSKISGFTPSQANLRSCFGVKSGKFGL